MNTNKEEIEKFRSEVVRILENTEPDPQVSPRNYLEVEIEVIKAKPDKDIEQLMKHNTPEEYVEMVLY